MVKIDLKKLVYLLNKLNDYPDKVVTANRVKRSEGFFSDFVI